MRKNLFGVIVIGVIMLNSCQNSTLAELNFDKLSYETPHIKKVSLNLKKGQKLEFWSKIDIEFEGDLEMAYIVELWENGAKIGGFELNPLKTNPTYFSNNKQIGTITFLSFQGKIDFLKIDHNGYYTFKAIAYCSNPNIKHNEVKLVFK